MLSREQLPAPSAAPFTLPMRHRRQQHAGCLLGSPPPREGCAAEPGTWALHHVWVALMRIYGMNFPGMWICFQILLQTSIWER